MGAILAPYRQAVEELKVKLKGIRTLYEYEEEHSPIEFVTGRVKPVPSILEKAKRKNIPLHNIESMQDIAGLRIMCQFLRIFALSSICFWRERTSRSWISATISRNIKRAATAPTTSSCCTLCRQSTGKNRFWLKFKSGRWR